MQKLQWNYFKQLSLVKAVVRAEDDRWERGIIVVCEARANWRRRIPEFGHRVGELPEKSADAENGQKNSQTFKPSKLLRPLGHFVKEWLINMYNILISTFWCQLKFVWYFSHLAA